MGEQSLLDQARAAYAARQFRAARDAFQQLDIASLSGEDLQAYSDAVWWLGDTEAALELTERTVENLLAEGARLPAAIEATGLGFLHMLRGDFANGSAWMARTRSMLQESDGPLEQAHLANFRAEAALRAGDTAGAIQLAREVEQVAREQADPNLMALALMTRATARIRDGEIVEGFALVDEAMVPVRAGEVAPGLAGNLYCQTIALCWELADIRRARAWTDTTLAWCEGFDRAVMFTGICRMHRVQLDQLGGRWEQAHDEAQVVCTELEGMNIAVVAEGHYLLGDLERLRGNAAAAERAYRRAHQLGRDPQPGLALLRADAGQPGAALSSLRTAVEAATGPDYARTPVLRALVEVAVEAGDLDVARDASEQIDHAATTWGTDGLRAAAAHASGAVRRAGGDAPGALAPLRQAVQLWRDLDAPHDCACARMHLGAAYTDLDDTDSAELEFDAAADTFQSLGASTDLGRLTRLRRTNELPGGLTPREAQVLLHVAKGGTNREVADVLVISEKTVARHLANIYRKLDVGTRTSAAAWARANGLT